MKVREIIIPALIMLAVVACDKKMTSSGQMTAKVRWLRMYSLDDWTDWSPRLMRTDSNECYLAGISHTRDSEGTYVNRLWIASLDKEGNLIWRKSIFVPFTSEIKKLTWERITCLQNERLIIACAGTPKERIWMMRFDKNGNVSFSKELQTVIGYPTISYIARIEDGYLVCGRKEKDAWAGKLDLQGNLIWQKTYDKEKTEAALSMAAEKDGSFTLAADSGTYNKFGAGESSVWIIKCDNIGNIVSEALFEGRHPSIARIKNGTCAVCFNSRDFPFQSLQVVGLDKNLKQIWKCENLSAGAGLGMEQIATDSNDSFIIAGSKSEKIWLWKINDKGRIVWTAPAKNEKKVVVVESLIVNDGEYILAGAASLFPAQPSNDANEPQKKGRWDLNDILVANIEETQLN